jgi:hypothetical protein
MKLRSIVTTTAWSVLRLQTEEFQIFMVAANILNKQLGAADNG